MGFASKLSMGFSSKGKPEHEVALTSPDTQFGPKPVAAAPLELEPAPPPAAEAPADDAASPLSLGGIIRRKVTAARRPKRRRNCSCRSSATCRWRASCASCW